MSEIPYFQTFFFGPTASCILMQVLKKKKMYVYIIVNSDLGLNQRKVTEFKIPSLRINFKGSVQGTQGCG